MKINIHLTKKKRRLLTIVCIAICVVGAAFYTVFIQPNLSKEQWVYKETKVVAGDLTVGVTEIGTLTYGVTKQSYDISIDTSDADEEEDTDDDTDDETTIEKYLKIEDIYIVVGQKIIEGDPVIKFTDDSVEDVRKILTSSLTDSEIAYSEAKSEYDVDVLSAKKVYESSLIEENYAPTILSQTLASIQAEISEKSIEIEGLSSDIANLQDSIADATDAVSEAKAVYDVAIDYAGSANLSNILVYVPAITTLQNAKEKYESAVSNLDKINSDIESKQEQIVDLQDDILAEQAKKNIDNLSAKQSYEMSLVSGSMAESIYQTTIASLQETLDSAKSDEDTSSDQLSDFEDFVGNGTIYAKGSGIVTDISYEISDSLVTEGTMFSYAKEDEMSITVDISQEDVININVGDAANIEFSAYPEEIYEGIITAITSTSTSESSATVSYPVTILVNGDTSKLYGGMTADITFITETRENTLYVSKKAIVEENGKMYVYIMNKNKYELSEVTTGLSNGIDIEILSGLNEGDVVYIATQITDSAEDTQADAEEKNSTDETATETNETSSQTSNDSTSNLEENGQMPVGQMPEGQMPGGLMP